MTPTEKKIERFYNKNREIDVKYCKFENISPKLAETIKTILENGISR
jgi:hypothetical protein